MSELQIGDKVQTGKKLVKMSELQIRDQKQTFKKSMKMSEILPIIIHYNLQILFMYDIQH